jgi:uncharacterized protein with HEPN domain
MIIHAREALATVSGRNRTDLYTDREFAMLLSHLMEIVGEASRRVPQDFRLRYPETDWRGFVGLRDVLVHRFDEIEYDTLWRIAREELPTLVSQLEGIMERET